MIHEATTPAAALKWAEFSGDFNPIHFDPVQAAKAGSDQLIVHGMLALLHVKFATMQALKAAAPAEGWSRFKALFRSPIPQNSALGLSLRSKNETVRFALEGDGREYSRGLHEAATAPLEQPNGTPVYTLESAFVQTQYAQFRDSFQEVYEDWIFLDALIFGKFLEQRFAQLAQMSPDIIAMQVSHSVSYDAHLLQSLFRDEEQIPAVGYTVRNEDKSTHPQSESGIAQLDVFVDNKLVMQIEIGLLAKAGMIA